LPWSLHKNSEKPTVTAGTSNPRAQGRYRVASRHRDVIHTSGMTPRIDGVLQYTGPVKADDPLEKWKDATVLSCRNAYVAAKNLLEPGEKIHSVVSMTAFIWADEGFTLHTKLADYASNFLYDELGDVAVGSRAAVGVASLPGGAPIEIQMVVAVE